MRACLFCNLMARIFKLHAQVYNGQPKHNGMLYLTGGKMIYFEPIIVGSLNMMPNTGTFRQHSETLLKFLVYSHFSVLLPLGN